MRTADFAEEYQRKTDEELLRLEMDSEALIPEAKASLTSEIAKRGINAQRIRTFREGKELSSAEILSGTRLAPLIPETDSYTVGSSLPAEKVKAPWRPKTAGRIAFFFGPLAGAQVVAISLRRMGYQQAANKVRFLALGFAILEVAILVFVPDAIARLIGIGFEIAFLMIFPVLMEKEFGRWQADHPATLPSSGWRAVGWGFLGILMFFVVALVVFIVLGMLVPTMVPR